MSRGFRSEAGPCRQLSALVPGWTCNGEGWGVLEEQSIYVLRTLYSSIDRAGHRWMTWMMMGADESSRALFIFSSRQMGGSLAAAASFERGRRFAAQAVVREGSRGES
jgi:hypothetical protein